MQIMPDAISGRFLAAAVLGAVVMLLLHGSADAQPSPGYYPSSMVRSMPFSQDYSILWGPQHQSLSQDQSALTLWMDRSSGITSLVILSLF